MAKRYMGHIALDPHPQSPYVRVNCPLDNLSMKADLNGYAQADIKMADAFAYSFEQRKER